MDIAAAWCVFFKRRHWTNPLRPRTLKHAYRAPSFFLGRMREAGHTVSHVVVDEKLVDAHFSLQRIHESAEIFYLTTHGVFQNGYEALLNTNNWSPCKTGIGGGDTVVAIFDTCNLIDSARNWRRTGSATPFGPRLRLMLGFDNLAAIGRGHALRGFAFAENLINGDTFVDAWFKAVASTTAKPHNKAVAIGIGDNQSEAAKVLSTASLANMPPARTGSNFFLELKP